MSSYILSVIEENGFDTKWLVSQGYDGASVMSGKNNGVQKRIKEVAPQAMYVHCHAHCLNLVLVDCVKNYLILMSSSSCCNCYMYFSLHQRLIRYMFLIKQLQLHPDKPVRQIQHLSETRWACRYAAVDTICSTYDSILATLESRGRSRV